MQGSMRRAKADIWKKRVLALLTAAALASGMAGEPGAVCAAGEEAATWEAEPVMGSVPYFQDDAGRNTQIAGDCLYGYWDRRLCRYDLDTMEETVLYEAASPQHGDFCIWGDYIYFMVIPNVTAVGSLHGYLYRVKCDGSEEAVCLTSVKLLGQMCGGQYYEYYKMDTYDDVLYLIRQYYEDDNLYFRLDRDGGITRIPESETLYGKLPEGYSPRGLSAHPDNLITLPYAMRNYGYVFARDENGSPVRFHPDSRQTESLNALDDYLILTITNDAVIITLRGICYRASLDDICDIEEIGEFPWDCSFDSWDRDGLYCLSNEEDTASLFFVNWKGEMTYLQRNFMRSRYTPIHYFGEKEYYYVAEVQGQRVVRRLGLTADAIPEQVAVYSSAPSWGIAARETYDYGWRDDYTGARVDIDITEVHFKEDTGAFGKINDFLDELYERDMESMEYYREAVNSDFDWEQVEKRGAEYAEYCNIYEVCFLDEDYVGVAAHWLEDRTGTASGMHGTIYYMFDRHTGERIFITDVVDSSAVEICEIIAPYVEAAAAWGTDDEGWESVILEEGRFFLSEEGIGIHFDVREINGINGDQEIIVPYRAFDLSLPSGH